MQELVCPASAETDFYRLPGMEELTERVVRGVVVGRRNHGGSRSEQGTKAAALIFSLLDSAELARVDPAMYLEVAVQAALDGEVFLLSHELAEDRRVVK